MTIVLDATPNQHVQWPPKVVWEQPYEVATDAALGLSRILGWAILDLEGLALRPRSLSFPPLNTLVGHRVLYHLDDAVDVLSLEPSLEFDGFISAAFAPMELAPPPSDFD